MSKKQYNSLESTVTDLREQTKNSLNILTALNQITTSNDKEEKIEILVNGEKTEFSIPTIVSLKTDFERLDKNIRNLSGIDESNTNIRMSDGTFRRVHLSKLESRPENITALSVPTEFKGKNNWFFENFISPYLYVELNVTGQISPFAQKAKIKRYLLNPGTQEQIEYWNSNLNGNSTINYNDFLAAIRDFNFTYQVDEQVIDLPLNTLTLKGKFSVLEIRDQDLIRNINGTNKQILTRIYKLNTMNYIDTSNIDEISTRSLAVGDHLMLNDSQKNTKFRVIYVDNNEQEIALERVEGYGAITPGDDRLQIFSSLNEQKNIEVGIGVDEQQVVFVKSVDPDFHIDSAEFSPGIGFDSSVLTINLPASLGGRTTLREFYKRYAVDFGVKIFNEGQDRIPPTIYAETPRVPLLAEDNFNVKQINTHITESAQAEQLRTLYKDKLDVEAQLSTVNDSIRDLREFLLSNQLGEQERRERQNTLDSLEERKSSLTSSLRNITNEIISIGRTNPSLTFHPKYRVRGFWDMPSPRESEKTAPQEIVQFVIQYRYIRPDGDSTNPDLVEYTDNAGNRRSGIFSRWIEKITPARKRIYDDEQRRYIWEEQDPQDGEQQNINSLDIPISYGESVEVRVQSVSEAGWPNTPARSDWSQSVIIEFPEELIDVENITSNIIRDAIEEQLKLRFEEELSLRGLNEHLSSQEIIENRLYLHQGKDISVTTDEGTTSSVQEEMARLKKQINDLESLIFAERSTVQVNTTPPGTY